VRSFELGRAGIFAGGGGGGGGGVTIGKVVIPVVLYIG